MTARGDDTPIFWQVADDHQRGRLTPGRHRWRTDPPTAPLPRGAAVTHPYPTPPPGGRDVDATERDARRVLADRGYRGPEGEPVHVLLDRVLDELGARSTDPYGTGGSYEDTPGRRQVAPDDSCAGEDRSDPASWADPDIAEPWEQPPPVEAVDAGEAG